MFSSNGFVSAVGLCIVVALSAFGGSDTTVKNSSTQTKGQELLDLDKAKQVVLASWTYAPALDEMAVAVRGRGARLAPVVPERTPVLGRAVHDRASLSYRQRLAPAFLDAWDAA